ncbi:Rod shape-determining protein MreD [Fulvivirgaceae bacterium BMA10]|uniref:Rod shape-determining protein MreD n=1 Tax=Splendidivirga corallicola TaxID=3051826 RepID=A0ABT8KRW4_9BACT|nr:Rod shape-determining protein MreD [Fulvivirgaceae bacterium BMA10]
MDNKNYVKQILYFILYLSIQVIFIKNVVLFGRGFCFLYIVFLLLLPLEIGPLALMLIGFLTGFIVDVFYDSLGMHAAACVLIMFLRPHLMNVLTPRGGYEQVPVPTLKLMGLEWFSTYTFILVFIHSMALFYIEAGGFNRFFFTFSKVISSSILTFILIIILQYLFYMPKRRI